MDADLLAPIIGALIDAMDAEGIEASTRRRVMNRLIWGHPHGNPAATMTAGGGTEGEPTACPDSSLLAWGLHEVDPDGRWQA